jgi:hypothetical protein
LIGVGGLVWALGLMLSLYERIYNSIAFSEYTSFIFTSGLT